MTINPTPVPKTAAEGAPEALALAAPPSAAPLRLDSARSFGLALQQVLAEALQSRARTLSFWDADFAQWPLDDLAVLAPLAEFVRLPGRTLRLLAQDYRAVQRGSPRFVAWRRTWGHAIDARLVVDAPDPCNSVVLVDKSRGLHILDRERWLGHALAASSELRALNLEFDAFWQHAEAGFAPTTLGLG